MVGRKISVKTDLPPPPATMKATPRLSWWVGRTQAGSCALILLASWGAGWTVGLQKQDGLGATLAMMAGQS